MAFWTTLNVAPDRRIGYWREVLSEAFIALDSSAPRSQGFAGSVSAERVADINVTRLLAQEHRVVRGPGEIRRTPLAYYFVNMQVQGEVLAAHQGREVHVRPNEFYVVDSTEPYDLQYRDAQEIFSFRVPKPLLDTALQGRADFLATRVSRDTPMGAIAVDFLQSIVRRPQAIPMAAGRSVAGMIAEMVALSLGGATTRQEGPVSVQQTLLQAIMQAVEQRLMDPELSVQWVCRRFAISERYLHRLFEQADVTFGAWVRGRRLERCADDLVARPALAISGVALAWGFSDISHFNHSFRRRFQMSPREYRRQRPSTG